MAWEHDKEAVHEEQGSWGRTLSERLMATLPSNHRPVGACRPNLPPFLATLPPKPIRAQVHPINYPNAIREIFLFSRPALSSPTPRRPRVSSMIYPFSPSGPFTASTHPR